MTDDEPQAQALGAFTRKVWALERLAKKQGGYIKLVPAQPTRLKAYAARLYRAASRMSFVDLENVTPEPGEVCAFAPPPEWRAITSGYYKDVVTENNLLKVGTVTLKAQT